MDAKNLYPSPPDDLLYISGLYSKYVGFITAAHE